MSSELERDDEHATFVLKPNPVPDWRQVKVFYALVGGTSLLVGGSFAVMGMWPSSAWARVHLVRPRHRNYPSRLLITAGKERVEIGRFLLEHERQTLARELRVAVAAVVP